MTEITSHPLAWPAGWPRTKTPGRSAFKVDASKIYNELVEEVKRIGGNYPVVSTNLPVSRRGGLPLLGADDIHDSGVAVYFMRNRRQMVFACDRWDRVRDNMRAVQRTIEALRGIDRWGASTMMERSLEAFVALPGNTWRTQLGFLPEDKPTATEVQDAFRRLAKRFHPDNGGSTEAFAKITTAHEEAKRELGL